MSSLSDEQSLPFDGREDDGSRLIHGLVDQNSVVFVIVEGDNSN